MERLKWLHRSTLYIFGGLLIFRLCNALAVSTFHVADEYWQSVEVAHRMVFGYGYLTWEWQPTAAIRSHLHPMLIAILYKFLQLTGLDSVSTFFIIKLPSLIQACFVALAETCFFSVVRNHHGHNTSYWWLALQVFNFTLWNDFSRTIANSVETILVMLFYYLWTPMSPVSPVSSVRRRLALTLAAVCFIIRPTSGVTWAVFGIFYLIENNNILEFLIESIVIPTTIIMASVLLDSWFFGSWVFPLWSFLSFNFLSSGADHYGIDPWYKYILLGLPELMGPMILPALLGYYQSWRPSLLRNKLLHLPLINTLALSLVAHKESRFLMFLIPFLNIFAAKYITSFSLRKRMVNPLNRFFSKTRSRKGNLYGELNLPAWGKEPLHFECANPDAPQGPLPCNALLLPTISLINSPVPRKSTSLHVVFILALLLPSAIVGVTISSLILRNLDVVHIIRDHTEMKDVVLLLPCHNTPGLAYIHRSDIKLDFLDCSPGLPPGSLDESDMFKAHPLLFLQQHFENNESPISNGNHSTFVLNPMFFKDDGLGPSQMSSPSAPRRLPTYLVTPGSIETNQDVIAWLLSRYDRALVQYSQISIWTKKQPHGAKSGPGNLYSHHRA